MDQSAEKDKDVTKKDDKVKEKEKKKSVENSGYYINRPKFGNNGPSKLKQQFSQGLTLLLVVIVCIFQIVKKQHRFQEVRVYLLRLFC